MIADDLSGFSRVKNLGEVNIIYHSLTGKYLLFKDENELTVDNLKSKGLVAGQDKEILSEINRRFDEAFKIDGLKNLNIMLTKDCNLNCSYCMAKDSHSSMEFNELIFCKIEEFFSSTKQQDISVSFVGREPLVAFDKLKMIVNFINNMDLLCNIKYSMNTNLILLDEEKLRFLFDNNFDIHSSIDGTKEYHDLLRKDKNGNGTFDIIINKLNLIKEFGYDVSGFHLTITESNIDMDISSFIAFMKENNFYDLIIEPNIFSLKLPPEELASKLVNMYLKLYEENISVDGFWVRPYKKLILSDDYENYFSDDDNLAFCGAFSPKSVALMVNGDINLCSYSNLKIPFNSISNKFNIDFKSFIKDNIIGNLEFCKGCDIEGLCRGGCYIVREYDDEQFTSVRYNCELYKNTTDLLLKASLC